MDIFALLSGIVCLLPSRAKDRLERSVFMDEISCLPENNKLNHPVLGIAFGGDDSRVQVALDLYKKGIIDVIMVTGGIGKYSKDQNTPEASLWREELQKNGVPMNRIWVENKSKNTLENTIFCAGEIERVGTRWAAIVCITNDYHMKRTVSLLHCQLRRLHFDFGRHLFWYGVEGDCSRENWRKTKKGRALILKEYIRLTQYRRTGKI